MRHAIVSMLAIVAACSGDGFVGGDADTVPSEDLLVVDIKADMAQPAVADLASPELRDMAAQPSDLSDPPADLLCGRLGMPCCLGVVCAEAGAVCHGGHCVGCGARGRPCCASKTPCVGGSSCNPDASINPGCR